MQKQCGAAFLILLCLAVLLGCAGDSVNLNPNDPVTITIWHNYGGQMQNAMDALLDEFNNTVGREKGIVVSSTSISSSAALQEKLIMAANGDPGAPQLPNLTTCYPTTALLLANNGLAVDLDTLFTPEELEGYLPAFLEEGRPEGKELYVFPIAKSTEVLFVNRTLFDRFGEATGISIESLATFEGIAQAACAYYRWTDEQTPDVPNDGKAFFMADSWFNVAMIGGEQLGAPLLENRSLNLESDTFRHVFETCLLGAVQGGFSLYDGYSSELSKVGDIVCSTGSTAGILFYGSTITYPDNTVEAVTYEIYPYPVFEGGDKVAVQRGGGISVLSSTPEKEYASGVFLKWFTAPEQNMAFVASTGYLPVTQAAFGESMQKQMETVDEDNISKLLEVAVTMWQEYEFFIPPSFDGYDTIAKNYVQQLRQAAEASKSEYFTQRTQENVETVLKDVLEQGFERFKQQF